MSAKPTTNNLDFIILTSSRWDNQYSSSILSIAKEISKSHRVFLIENPFTWKDYIFKRRTKSISRRKEALLKGKKNYYTLTEDKLIAVTPRLMLPINWLPRGLLYNTVSRVNEFIFSKCIQGLLKDYTITNFVYVNSFLPFYLKKQPSYFKPKLFVYQTIDDIDHSKYFSKHGGYLENEMIRKADITLATSTRLYDLKKEIAKTIHIIPNAADISLFKTSLEDQLAPPPELKEEKRKVIIYVGNTIAERTDFNILKTLLTDHPDKLLLMVGPYDEIAVNKSGILAFPNLRLLSAQPMQQIPAYLQYAHCAIIPFLSNTLTESIYPLKVNEYLAAGKPVVTTPFSEDIVSFKNIYVADNPKEFSKLIGQAIEEDSREKGILRLAEVKHNSWKGRAERFLEIVYQAYDQKAS